MPETEPGHITRLLREVSTGNETARRTLLDQVYAQLRTIAQDRMSHERGGHTLQATALVHEAYLRLLGTDDDQLGQPVEWRDRRHFYGASAEAMRRILIDHARRRGAEKRGGDWRRTALMSVCDLAANDDPQQIVALDDALLRLQEADASAAEIVRLRFLAGLSVEHTAKVLGISERTVKREWTYARAKLFRLLHMDEASNGHAANES